jgi:hypothetical protein
MKRKTVSPLGRSTAARRRTYAEKECDVVELPLAVGLEVGRLERVP